MHRVGTSRYCQPCVPDPRTSPLYKYRQLTVFFFFAPLPAFTSHIYFQLFRSSSSSSAFSHSAQYWTSFTQFSIKISETCHALAYDYDSGVFKRLFETFILQHQQQDVRNAAREQRMQNRERDHDTAVGKAHANMDQLMDRLRQVCIGFNILLGSDQKLLHPEQTFSTMTSDFNVNIATIFADLKKHGDHQKIVEAQMATILQELLQTMSRVSGQRTSRGLVDLAEGQYSSTSVAGPSPR